MQSVSMFICEGQVLSPVSFLQPRTRWRALALFLFMTAFFFLPGGDSYLPQAIVAIYKFRDCSMATGHLLSGVPGALLNMKPPKSCDIKYSIFLAPLCGFREPFCFSFPVKMLVRFLPHIDCNCVELLASGTDFFLL